jgi:hypothetical protein
MIVLATLLAAVAAACAGCGGGTAATPTTTTVGTTAAAPKPAPAKMSAAVAQVHRELSGIRQTRLMLGDPKAPVTIVEYTSLSCSLCAQIHRALVPQVIARYVRTGRANLELRTFTDTAASLDLALSAWAATTQKHGWDVAQLAFLRGSRAGGRPSEPGSTLVAALGLDVPGWKRALPRPDWKLQIGGARQVVSLAHFAGDPVFLVRGRGAKEPFIVVTQPNSLSQFDAAITKAEHA